MNAVDPSGLDPDFSVTKTEYSFDAGAWYYYNWWAALSFSAQIMAETQPVFLARPVGGGGEDRWARRIDSAFNTAVKAMLGKDCAGLFGLAGSPDPYEVLAKLLARDPAVGMLLIDAIESPPGATTSAITAGFNWYPVDIGNGAQQLRAGFVQVTINSQAGSFVDGSKQDQATTLLHELGHVFSALYGPQSTKIVSDSGDVKGSEANTALVKEKCFK